jgi:SAM-dependent methyltransferase
MAAAATLTVAEEQRRYKSFIHADPIGFTHNMRPSSVQLLIDHHIGIDRIRRSRILEVGCGQGYLVSHFLNTGAAHVTGTEVEQHILSTIPLQAYQRYRDNGQTVTFQVEDFMNTPLHVNFDIITLIIGAEELVYRLLDLFTQNQNVHTIAFMKPVRGRAELQERLDDILQNFPITSETFPIHLSISGEQRQVIVLKKTTHRPPPKKPSSNVKSQFKRLGFSKRAISRVYSSSRKRSAKQ